MLVSDVPGELGGTSSHTQRATTFPQLGEFTGSNWFSGRETCFQPVQFRNIEPNGHWKYLPWGFMKENLISLPDPSPSRSRDNPPPSDRSSGKSHRVLFTPR